MNDQTVKDVQCGNRVECFLNHPNIRVSIALPGRDFSKPFDIVESGPTGIAHLFNKDSREKYAIGIPSARSTSGRFTNYIAFEAVCDWLGRFVSKWLTFSTGVSVWTLHPCSGVCAVLDCQPLS